MTVSVVGAEFFGDENDSYSSQQHNHDGKNKTDDNRRGHALAKL